ncbi:calpastatin-like isoform X9 [Brienomyrus brachyistius]|uniref:calpastatin-like isoform X9 n=1 Tax=Brienomyrus brachyistius TaxID=42636 RepID=UPI0020B40E19|nr:calpastatin-like isoform X9 [Brienomyrus brachyistius]
MAYAKYWMWLQTQNTAPYDSKSRHPVDVVSVSHSKSVSACSNFSNTLPSSKPVPTIIEEGIIKAETRSRLGERDDTLPPHYRTPKESVPVAPVPVENTPSMDSETALDILTGDFILP